MSYLGYVPFLLYDGEDLNTDFSSLSEYDRDADDDRHRRSSKAKVIHSVGIWGLTKAYPDGTYYPGGDDLNGDGNVDVLDCISYYNNEDHSGVGRDPPLQLWGGYYLPNCGENHDVACTKADVVYAIFEMSTKGSPYCDYVTSVAPFSVRYEANDLNNYVINVGMSKHQVARVDGSSMTADGSVCSGGGCEDDEFIDPSTNDCVSSCANYPYLVENSGTRNCEPCPSDKRRYQSSNNTCHACPSNTPRYSDNSDNTCHACPSDTPWYQSSDNTCKACPLRAPVYKPNDNACVCEGAENHYSEVIGRCSDLENTGRITAVPLLTGGTPGQLGCQAAWDANLTNFLQEMEVEEAQADNPDHRPYTDWLANPPKYYFSIHHNGDVCDIYSSCELDRSSYVSVQDFAEIAPEFDESISGALSANSGALSDEKLCGEDVSDIVWGCKNPTGCNYNPNATHDGVPTLCIIPDSYFTCTSPCWNLQASNDAYLGDCRRNKLCERHLLWEIEMNYGMTKYTYECVDKDEAQPPGVEDFAPEGLQVDFHLTNFEIENDNHGDLYISSTPTMGHLMNYDINLPTNDQWTVILEKCYWSCSSDLALDQKKKENFYIRVQKFSETSGNEGTFRCYCENIYHNINSDPLKLSTLDSVRNNYEGCPMCKGWGHNLDDKWESGASSYFTLLTVEMSCVEDNCVSPTWACRESVTACNYNSSATRDAPCNIPDLTKVCPDSCGEDGSVLINGDLDGDDVCDLDEVAGCTNPDACNYNALATDDGSCNVPNVTRACNDTCLNGTVVVNDADGDGVCDDAWGCTNPDACNYKAWATHDDGSCNNIKNVTKACPDTCSTEPGPVILSMIDSWGDGWSGFQLSVGGTTYGSTFEDGTSQTQQISGLTGTIEVSKVDNDKYPSEVSFEIRCKEGNALLLSGDGSGSSWTFENTCSENRVVVNDLNDNDVCDEFEIDLGCTITVACNYNASAKNNDGSCNVPNTTKACHDACGEDGTVVVNGDLDGDGVCDFDEVAGCTNLLACNHNAEATDDDGSCNVPNTARACNDTCLNGAVVVNDADGDGVCDGDEVPGCTNLLACNHNASATEDDGSCIVPDTTGCPETCSEDGTVVNHDLDDDGVCDVDQGCMNYRACNFDHEETVPDQSCVLPRAHLCPVPESVYGYPNVKVLKCQHDVDENDVCDEEELGAEYVVHDYAVNHALESSWMFHDNYLIMSSAQVNGRKFNHPEILKQCADFCFATFEPKTLRQVSGGGNIANALGIRVKDYGAGRVDCRCGSTDTSFFGRKNNHQTSYYPDSVYLDVSTSKATVTAFVQEAMASDTAREAMQSAWNNNICAN